MLLADLDASDFVPASDEPRAVDLGLELPAGVALCAFSFAHSPQLLSFLSDRVSERPSPRAVTKRVAEFLAGRFAARAAIEQLGAPVPQTIATLEQGAPNWPPALVGSITHSDFLAGALVGFSRDYAGLGLDTEVIVETERADALLSHTGQPAELNLLQEVLACDRGTAFSFMFSAKESLYKCLYPSCGVFFGFSAARVIAAQGRRARGAVTLELLENLADKFVSGQRFQLQFVASATRVVTLATLAR